MIRLKVKEIAAQKGISQARLSRKSDVNITTLRRIYRQPTEANVTLDTLNKLAAALEVEPSALFDYTPDDSV